MWTLVLVLTAAAPLEQAQALEDQGNDAAAVALLDAAVKQAPGWAMGRVELGRLQLKLGDTDAALHHLDVARSLAPENPRAHYLFALAADEGGRRTECRRALEVALTLREGYADAQVRLAGVLMAEGEADAAARLLQSYASKHPEATGARLQLADALQRAGQPAAALHELRALYQLPALKVLAGRRLAALLEAQGKVAEAQRIRETIDPPKRKLRDLQPSGR
jgi:tetratricopeptide (TPR) repeat protein